MNNATLLYLKMPFQPQKPYGAELHLKTIISILYVHTRRKCLLLVLRLLLEVEIKAFIYEYVECERG
jgi:hypothetical protein